MCKHIVNATVRSLSYHAQQQLTDHTELTQLLQFAFRAPCCGRWFDCSECHFELSDHRLAAAAELALLCRACEQPFRKILAALGAEDEACPHCAAPLVVPTRLSPPAPREEQRRA